VRTTMTDKPTKSEKKLTVEEANKLLARHIPLIDSKKVFKKGDIVVNSPLCEVASTPLREGQEAFVAMAGKDAIAQTRDPERDTMINYIDVDSGMLSMAAMNNRFLQLKNNKKEEK